MASTVPTDPAVQKRKWESEFGPEKLNGRSGTKERTPRRPRKFRPRVKKLEEGGTEEVLLHDIKHLLKKHPIALPAAEDTLPEKMVTTIELDILELSSTGDGLGIHDGRVYTVPFALPGDRVSAKIVHHDETFSKTDFLSVLKPSPDRDDSLIGCKYFATCSGCQYQMVPYPKQLEIKRGVIEKAYLNFGGLTGRVLPEIGDTIGSPLQYGYRTKLTPHFNGLSGRKDVSEEAKPPPPPEIGFNIKNRRAVLDIEDCPIGTDIVRAGMKVRRQEVLDTIHTFKAGATLLLRESTTRIPEDEDPSKYRVEKSVVSDNNATFTEYIGDFRFVGLANSFFQNNNSILPTFTEYIRKHIVGDYLVDAYCGSGLFSITCSGSVTKAIGIDVSNEGITYAKRNAELNGVQNATFIMGKAEQIFADIDKIPGSETTCIIDPPRKGCDQTFLNQLLDFLPKRIVYVSCNVHTQARDLGVILSDTRGAGYKVDSIRGFDFFPQTHHVESVAVLTLEESGFRSDQTET